MQKLGTKTRGGSLLRALYRGTYSNVDVDAANKCVPKPHEAIHKVEERKQERHVFHTSGPDHHPLHGHVTEGYVTITFP